MSAERCLIPLCDPLGGRERGLYEGESGHTDTPGEDAALNLCFPQDGVGELGAVAAAGWGRDVTGVLSALVIRTEPRREERRGRPAGLRKLPPASFSPLCSAVFMSSCCSADS